MKKLYRFLFVAFLIFCYSYFGYTLYLDEIWNYGFAYNIVNGLVPYRDFNMIVTPLYAFLSSIFIKVFGHHLWGLHIFNAIIISVMIFIMKSCIGKKVLIIIPVLLLYIVPSYNLFSLFLMVILLKVCEFDFKYKDFVLGLLCGLLFLTKQTVGICMFIPLMIYSKNRKNSFYGYLIPIVLFFSYLLVNGALYQFVDYCFLGMFDFSNGNAMYRFLPFEIIVCFCLFYLLLKKKFKCEKVFYILMYQIITIPICDDYHFMMGHLLILYWCFENIKFNKYRYKYFFIVSLFCLVYWNYVFHANTNYTLYMDDNSYLYGRVSNGIDNNIYIMSKYLKDKSDYYDNIYIFTQISYMIKLNMDMPLNKFDLINDGNMGYNGSSRYVREINDTCIKESCLFILRKDEKEKRNQTNTDILDFVSEEYNKCDEVENFILYSN